MLTAAATTLDEFARLPLVIEGESKEVRYAGGGRVLIRFKPTIYSFTANRCAVVPGSDRLRLRAMRTFLEVLRRAGIPHAYQEVADDLVLADLVVPHEVEFARYGLPVFVPPDLTADEAARLRRAPPIEVVIKAHHTGTSKHRYLGMTGAAVRASHPLYAGMRLEVDDAYPETMVRFDWRNPLHAADGRRVQDEILPEPLADCFIDVARARATALRAYAALQDFLAPRDIVICDLCLFVTEDGGTIYGEITQDCGRYRHFELGHLDKDVWRTGGSHEQVLDKWRLLGEHLERPATSPADGLHELHRLEPGKRDMRFVIGTTNPYKVREFAAILRPTGCDFTPSEPFDVPETEPTFAGNARAKAVAYARHEQAITIAEDSGLSVMALHGLPGPYSARFADCELDAEQGHVLRVTPSGRSREVIDAANNARLLELLRGVPQPHRAAQFEVALAVAAPDGSLLFEATGTASGWIADAPAGEHGFGYDPLFVGQRTGGSTFAELDAVRKNLRSHRREVLRKLTVWLGRALRRRQELTVVLDGNDGTGKSTLAAALRGYGYRVEDRGLPTKLTDGPARDPLPTEVFLVLDVPVAVSQARLAAAGKDLTERYHTAADLAHYRERFLAVARDLPGAHVIDSSLAPEQTLGRALQVLLA
jgi:non-canonical purine NTP pyrophosphatase (RdgB/HAM1 family)